MFMPQPVLKIYYDALEEGKILGTKCPACGAVEWPPLPACNECGSIDMDWVTLSGEAQMDDFTPAYEAATYPPLKQFWPYHTFVGRLAEGTAITGLVFGINETNSEELKAKLPVKVKAKLLQLDGFKTVAWEVAE